MHARLARLGVAVAFVAVGLIGVASPAAANAGSGFAGCDDEGCDATVRRDEERRGEKDRGNDDRDRFVPNLQCVYSPLKPDRDYEIYLPDGTPLTFLAVDGMGELMEERCTLEGTLETRVRAVYLRTTTPEQLRDEARSRLRFPRLDVNLNPAGRQYVNTPTWLWVDTDQWQPTSATAAIPGLSVTVSARPVRVTWTMGDGGVVTCAGPGTPYDTRRRSADQRTDCSYNYERSSARQPSGAFRISGQVEWEVAWSIGGAAGGGALGVYTSETTPIDVQVGEVQPLNTDPRGS